MLELKNSFTFYTLVPTQANMKLSNENTLHAQGIGIILCNFSNCIIIYLVEPVYYCTLHPSNSTA